MKIKTAACILFLAAIAGAQSAGITQGTQSVTPAIQGNCGQGFSVESLNVAGPICGSANHLRIGTSIKFCSYSNPNPSCPTYNSSQYIPLYGIELVPQIPHWISCYPAPTFVGTVPGSAPGFGNLWLVDYLVYFPNYWFNYGPNLEIFELQMRIPNSTSVVGMFIKSQSARLDVNGTIYLSDQNVSRITN
jgi:hypothetical protein